PASLDGGGSFDVQVDFHPSASGTFQASLVIASDDGATPMARVSLAGDGAEVALTVAPMSLDASAVPVGSTRALAPAVLGNTSSSESHVVTALCVAAAGALTCGGADGFQIGEVVPLTLAPMGQLQIHVSFTPGAARAYGARLLIFLDDATAP